MKTSVDLFIIGGGINGAGIAADAAARGLDVTLCEQDDLANATSSKSTKLIHGGLRYLEYFEFGLVRAALKEREVLLKKAPHIITPMAFVLPHNKSLKPAWMLRLGLFLYDHLSKRQTLKASKHIRFIKHPAGNIIQDTFKEGFVYSDCWVDDAKLVILNAIAAKELGAEIITRTRFLNAIRSNDGWEITVENTNTAKTQNITAKALINAAGPWVDDVIHQRLRLRSSHKISQIKGSHIIVPKLYDEDFSFILPNTDNRIIFVIPYLENYSLIGTTDIPYEGNPNDAKITEEEVSYLCKAVNQYFIKPICANDIVSTYSGVRPLSSEDVDTPAAITRDYSLELSIPSEGAALLSVFGGKITTYRKLADQALNQLQPFFPQMKRTSTEDTVLPGGDLETVEKYTTTLSKMHPYLPQTLLQRWVKSYGTRVKKLLGNATSIADLGNLIGDDLYELEARYLIENEWAQTAEDILWRRTKLGLTFSEKQKEQLNIAITSITSKKKTSG